jgi:hypothetical protein
MKDKTEIITELKQLQADEDPESEHKLADHLLCEFLISLGHKDVVDEYDKVRKWYS